MSVAGTDIDPSCDHGNCLSQLFRVRADIYKNVVSRCNSQVSRIRAPSESQRRMRHAMQRSNDLLILQLNKRQIGCNLVRYSLVVLTLIALPRNVAGDEAKSEFFKLYEPCAKLLLERYTRNLHVQMTETCFDNQGKVQSKFQHRCSSNNSCVLVETLLTVRTINLNGSINGQTVENPVPKWDLLRPDGYFKIERSKNAGEHLVTEMIAPVTLEKAIEQYPLYNMFLSLAYRRRSIAAYIRQPSVTIIARSECQWRGQSVVRLHIQEAMPNLGVWDRSFYFDAGRDWLLVGVESQKEKNAGKVVQVHSYEPWQDDAVRPKKIEIYSSDSGKAERLVARIDYDEFARAYPEENEFALSRFGLPEPSRSNLGTGGFQIWLWLTGLMAAVLAIIVYLRARRKTYV